MMIFSLTLVTSVALQFSLRIPLLIRIQSTLGSMYALRLWLNAVWLRLFPALGPSTVHPPHLRTLKISEVMPRIIVHMATTSTDMEPLSDRGSSNRSRLVKSCRMVPPEWQTLQTRQFRQLYTINQDFRLFHLSRQTLRLIIRCMVPKNKLLWVQF